MTHEPDAHIEDGCTGHACTQLTDPRRALSDVLAYLADVPATDRVFKLGKRWVVTDIENPRRTLHSTYPTKKEAIATALRHERAVLIRLRAAADAGTSDQA